MAELTLFGRREITAHIEPLDPTMRVDPVNEENVLKLLQSALPVHGKNRSEIDYLYQYYKGKQDILQRVKVIRPEINNRVVENRANEIVSFKSGYLMGEPVQYVARGGDRAEVSENILRLNEYVFAEEKASKDKELSDWFHICGVGYRLVLPDDTGEEDEAPFETNVLDPRNTFVIKRDTPDREPLLGVTYVMGERGEIRYSAYSKTRYYEIVSGTGLGDVVGGGLSMIHSVPHVLGEVPIIEYPLNLSRQGAFEIVLPLLNAMNLLDSNRMDDVEQVVQALMVFKNVDISTEDYEQLRQRGAIKVRDIDANTRAEVTYLLNSLNQSQTQTVMDHLYQTMLTICGMPNRNGGSSTSDTGSAVIMRDGWSAAEARAKDAELMFKQAEKRFLTIVLNICRTFGRFDLRVSQVDIQFTRRNYENITEKANVLVAMLSNNKIHPRLAFVHCGMFTDPDLAYAQSEAYAKEQANESENNAPDVDGNRDDSAARESGGAESGAGASGAGGSEAEREVEGGQVTS